MSVLSPSSSAGAKEETALELGTAEMAVQRHGRWRVMVASIVVACAALPLLRPSGPGNTGLVDLALLCAILASLYWASSRSYRLRLPYALPAALTVLGGALAVLVTHPPAPR